MQSADVLDPAKAVNADKKGYPYTDFYAAYD